MEVIIAVIAVFVVGYLLGKKTPKQKEVIIPTVNPAPAMPIVEKDNIVVKPQLNIKKADIESLTLSAEQNAVFNELNSGTMNAYVTGKAGTGKSVLLPVSYTHLDVYKRQVLIKSPSMS